MGPSLLEGGKPWAILSSPRSVPLPAFPIAFRSSDFLMRFIAFWFKDSLVVRTRVFFHLSFCTSGNHPIAVDDDCPNFRSHVSDCQRIAASI